LLVFSSGYNVSEKREGFIMIANATLKIEIGKGLFGKEFSPEI